MKAHTRKIWIEGDRTLACNEIYQRCNNQKGSESYAANQTTHFVTTHIYRGQGYIRIIITSSVNYNCSRKNCKMQNSSPTLLFNHSNDTDTIIGAIQMKRRSSPHPQLVNNPNTIICIIEHEFSNLIPAVIDSIHISWIYSVKFVGIASTERKLQVFAKLWK